MTVSIDPTESRRRWHAQREHLIVASIGVEYISAFIFFVWGAFLLFGWYAAPPTPNPLIDAIQTHAQIAGLLIMLIGGVHLWALFAWPHTNRRNILLRKIGCAFELALWSGQFTANLLLILSQPSVQPSGFLGLIFLIPFIGFLIIAILRRLYRDW